MDHFQQFSHQSKKKEKQTNIKPDCKFKPDNVRN